MHLKRLLRFLTFGLAALATASSASAQIKVQMRPTWIAPTDNQIALVLNVVNTGSSTVALSSVTARYYFTKDGTASLQSWCDYTPRGCGNLTRTFSTLSPAAATADSYLQIGFTSGAGSLSPGQSTGDIQVRIAKSDWSNFNEANDWSYAANATLADDANITAYVSGALVWGSAPGGTTSGFTLAASPASLSVNQGASGTSTIAITRTSFTGAVAFTAAGLPAGVSASFAPSSTTGNSAVLTLTASSTATTGNGTITVTGTSGSTVRTATIALTVNPISAQGFTLSAAPASLGINQGASGTSTITITRTNFTSAVAFTASGLPAGVSASFAPSSTTGNSTVLTLTASSTATTGSRTITVTGAGGTLSRTVTIALTVNPISTQNFALSAAPASLTVARGSSATSTITITRTSFTSAVAFTASGAPTGVTATFTPSSTTANSTNVTFAASSTAALGGPVNVTVTGAGGTLTRTVVIALTVNPGGGGDQPVFRVNTSGRVTKDGVVFPVHCGSWFGLQGRYEISSDAQNPRGAPMEQYVGNTFWGSSHSRTVMQTMNEIKAGGLNVIRLPVVHQTLDPNDPQGKNFLKNHSTIVNDPTYPMRNSLEGLQSMLKAANAAGVYVLLDIHSCSNYVDWRKGRLDARPPWADATRENYDYKREEYSCAASGNPSTVKYTHPYNETLWLQDLTTLASLPAQLGVSNVIGIDIYNEPWDYTWVEWRTLIEHAYTAIDAVNPNILIFAQGISGTAGNEDGTPTTIVQVPHGDAATNPNWGENLYEAGGDPPAIPKNRLVFSPHTYGPSVFVQRMFMDPAQPACAGLEGDAAAAARCNIVIDPPLLRAGWEEHFGYLKQLGYAVIVGEWGGNMQWPKGKASLRDQQLWSYLPTQSVGVDEQWQNAFSDYMVSKGIESCYWSVNPESGDTGGWYGTSYDPVSNTGGWGDWTGFDSKKTAILRKVWNGVP